MFYQNDEKEKKQKKQKKTKKTYSKPRPKHRRPPDQLLSRFWLKKPLFLVNFRAPGPKFVQKGASGGLPQNTQNLDDFREAF